MFNLSEWLTAGIINGYETGMTPFARVTELTAGYLSKGLINDAQAEQIATACPAPNTVQEESGATQGD